VSLDQWSFSSLSLLLKGSYGEDEEGKGDDASKSVGLFVGRALIDPLDEPFVGCQTSVDDDEGGVQRKEPVLSSLHYFY